MDHNEERIQYSFQPVDQTPPQPQAQQPYAPQPEADAASPLIQAKAEIRRGRHTGVKIVALLAVLAIVATVGSVALTRAIEAIEKQNLATQPDAAAMGEQDVADVPQDVPASSPAQSDAPYRLESTPLPETLPSNAGNKTLTPAQVYQMNIDAVCGIATEVTTNVWGQTSNKSCAGSGFVLSEDGYVITNNHVVANATKGSVVVRLYSGEEYPATVVGADSMSDVALLKIEATGLPTVTLGDSDQLEVGEMLEAIGNPLGELTFTMTVGYLSALDREINADGTPINMIQTDAAINAGNSGGPLFDMNGNVVGVTSAKISGLSSSGVSIEGLGFAIPINDVLRVVYDLQQYGRVRGRAYLGITLQDLDSNVAKIYNLPAGPQIVTVTEGSCAEKAGLQPQDIIIRFEDTEIGSYTDLTAALRDKKAGDTVTMRIFRAGAEVDLTITLDERPDEATVDQTEQDANSALQDEPVIPSNGSIEDYYGDFEDFFGEFGFGG